MFKKLTTLILMLLLITSIATAEYYEGDIPLFVSNPNGAVVWSSPEIGSYQFEILPAGACFFNYWYPETDEFVAYDYGGDTGYILWEDLAIYPDDNMDLPPLYVAYCEEWISIWQDPEIGSSRLGTLPLGTKLTSWEPYSAEFIWLDNGNKSGFVAWEYLSYNYEGLM